jgi:tetraacyldisaccharide 4'-kinase
LGLIVHHHAYPDHHAYSKKDTSFFSDKTIITTEKDFTKLRTMDINNLFYLPIKTKIHEHENFLTHMSLKI